MTKPNKPQLSEEMEKRLTAEIKLLLYEYNQGNDDSRIVNVVECVDDILATAIEERTKLCKQVYVEGIDWAEWVISDELAGQLFDEDLADLLNKKEKQP